MLGLVEFTSFGHNLMPSSTIAGSEAVVADDFRITPQIALERWVQQNGDNVAAQRRGGWVEAIRSDDGPLDV